MEDKGDCHHFTSDKARVLAKADLSRKGSVDGPIRDLVEFINTQECYYTTSSCSGRISVFSEVIVLLFQKETCLIYNVHRVMNKGRKVAGGYWCHMTRSTYHSWYVYSDHFVINGG